MKKAQIIILISFLICFDLQTFFCQQLTYEREKPQEYVGCFKEDTNNRVFIYTPDDYRMNELSPIQCMVTCGQRYKYAAIQQGIICMCSDVLRNQPVNESNCNSVCPGTVHYPSGVAKPKCGGNDDVISVYSNEYRILGLKIANSHPVTVFDETHFYVQMKNGKDSAFTFTFGDGSNPMESKTKNITHLYDRPGHFEVKLKARNNASGTEETSKFISVVDKQDNVTITCPKAIVLGKPMKCNGTLSRGSSSTSIVDYDAKYSYVGRKIPSSMKLKNELKSSPATFIIPSSEFRKMQIISSWEIDASAPGSIVFQIFRPVCKLGEVFCHEQHACISKDSKCNSIDEIECKSNEIFCLHCGKCLPFENQSMIICQKARHFNISSPPSDYQLVYQHLANVPVKGHRFIKLKNDERFTAKPGDVLGWTFKGEANSGQASFIYDNQDDDTIEFQFPSITTIGTKVERRNAIKTQMRHLISVHFYEEALFTLHHVYNNTGAYLLTINISKPIQIFVDIPITGVDLICPSLVKTNSKFNLTISKQSGSNVTYEWFANDDSSSTKTSSGRFSYAYTKPNIYQFTIFISNSLSLVQLSCSIRALDIVNGLRLRHSLGSTSFGHQTNISWVITSGTNVTYTINYGDGSDAVLKHVVGSGQKELSAHYSYKSEGIYNVTITADNDVGPKLTISSQTFVEVPLRNLRFYSKLPHVTDHVYIAKGEEIDVMLSIGQGSSPSCVYQFSNDLQAHRTQSLSIKHIFNKTGIYTAHVTCMNRVSMVNATLNTSIVVQEIERITDLKLTVQPTIYGHHTLISLTMTKGTLYFCDWQFGDGSTTKSEFINQQSPVQHRFQSIGDYFTQVSCRNRLGTVHANITVSVDIPISGLQFNCTTHFIQFGHPVLINSLVTGGSRVVGQLSWGDNKTNEVLTMEKNMVVKKWHVYNKIGSYDVQLVVSNKYHSIERKCPNAIKVEYAVEGIHIYANSPLKLSTAIAIYKWYAKPGFIHPTNALITWEFGDGVKQQKQTLELKSTSNVLTQHRYSSAGTFITKIKIENNVSSLSFNVQIDVQEMLPIALSIEQMLSSSGNNTLPGFGKDKNFFPLEKQIQVKITKQLNDKWYIFNFGDGRIINSTSSSVVHLFQKSGIYNVSVLIYNKLEQSEQWKVISIEESVRNINLKTASSIYLGEQAKFSINAQKYGTASCFILNFGDMNVIVLNNTQCPNFNEHTMYDYKYSNLATGNFSLNHTYKNKGKFNIKLKAMNRVSFEEISKDLEVVGQPCSVPTLSINGGGTQVSPLVAQRSERIILKVNTSFECERADIVIFTWDIFTVDASAKQMRFNTTSKNAKMPFKQHPGTLDITVHEIPNKFLPAGMNLVKLTLSFQSKTHNLGSVKVSRDAWFNIHATPLKASIKGGFRRTVSSSINLKLDASDSNDPDAVITDRSSLIFAWYCRRHDEVFTSGYKPISNTSGCFRNGHQNLSRNDLSLTSLQINTANLVARRSYFIRLIVKKDSRTAYFDQEIKVLAGDPPTMDIKCKMNCLDKLNSAERLILQSVCTDCTDSTKLSYMWSLYEITSSNIEGKVADFVSNTTTGINQANVVVRENALQLGKDYSLKISAWKSPENTADGEGSTEYRFKVNQPPSSGSCNVLPKSGFALVTKFKVICEHWVDEDMPLEYHIDVVREDNVANIYRGFENSIETVLPMGKVSSNYEMKINVKIFDRYGGMTEKVMTVKVEEPVSIDLKAVSDDLTKLSSSGNVQTLTQTALAVGSVMNSNSTQAFSIDQAISARTSILTAVSKVKACTIDQIKQIGDVYNEMTSKPEELTGDAQDASSSGMSDMSDCMLQSNPQDPSLKSAAITMLQGSSKLLQANSLRMGNKTINGTSKDSAVSNATSKVLDTVDKVGGALLRQLVAGDKPTVVKLANMNVQMSQIGDNADDESAGFKIPALKSLIGNDSSDGVQQSVGAMVSSMANNPYGNDATSDDIKSDILGLSLTDKNGKPINVAGQELQMFVTRDLKGKTLVPDMNAFDDSQTFRFHKFNYTSLENGVGIQVKPVDKKLKLRVLLSYGKRPSLKSYMKNHTFLSNEEASRKSSQLPEHSTYILSNGELNQTGQYYIGLVLLNKDKVYSDFGYIPSLNYSLLIFQSKCKVWNDELKIWSSKGCRVGPNTTYMKTQCICKIEDQNSDVDNAQPLLTIPSAHSSSQLSQNQNKPRRVVKRVSFAGGFFVAPNPIDFDKAFAGFANLAENPVAFSTVLAMFGVYLIMLFWARREDRKDILRAGVATLPDNDVSDRQFYEVTVFTGFGNSASTTSRVFIQISGEDGSSEARELCDASKRTFQKRAKDVFLVSCEDFLGDLTYLKIWHDNSGKRPSWYLSKVAIRDLNTNKNYLFINEAWLAVEEGDGSIERVLPIASDDEIASFNHLFYSTTQKNLTDSHLWFSVFIRPPQSRFTRVQRLSCCLTLIYCTMLTNAMFYQVGGQSNPSSTLKLGPFEFSASQIGIGVMSSLIIFPVNLLIVGVFRNVGAKPSKEELSKKKARKYWWLYEFFFCCERKQSSSEFMNIITSIPDSEADLKTKTSSNIKYQSLSESQLGSSDIGLNLDISEQGQSQKEEDKKKKKKKKKKFPWWMKYFAWTLLILTSFTSAFFVVLYGFTFGRDKSAQWISSMLISFVQDVFVTQPMKILFLGLFIALIVKKPAEEDEEDNRRMKDEVYVDEQQMKQDNESVPRRSNAIIKFQPPSKEKVRAARDLRLKEIKMYSIVKDIVIYFIFVTALCTVSYTHLDPRSYQFKKGLEDTFVSAAYGGDMAFSDISTREDYWQWMNDTVVNALFSTKWYNGKANVPGFTQDLYSNLFGGARLRQLRVKKDTCKVPDEITPLTTTCNDFYSWSNEDTDDYSLKWQPTSQKSSSSSSWLYFTSNELNTYPFAGKMALYGGGGYVGDLGKYPSKAYKLINELNSNNWFDERTRVIFMEACVYNAQVNLFAIMNFVAEFLPTNGMVVSHSVKIARLYTFGGSTESFTIACQFFVLFFLLLFVYRESKKIYKEGKKYFKGFWNMTEFTMIVLVIVTISVFFARMLLVKTAVKNIQDNPGKFVSFNKVAKWDDLFQYMMSFLVLVACIKSIRLLSFNKTISLLASTLKGSAKPLSAFSIVFFIFYFAYVIFAFIIFVHQLEDFRSFVASMESTMALLLGSFEFEEIKNAQRIIGPLYFLSLMLFGVMYILNVFLSIIMDTYADVKAHASKQSNEYEIVDFMIGRFKRFVGIQPGNKQTDKITDHDDNCDDNHHENHGIQKKHHFSKRAKHLDKSNCDDEELLKKFKKLDQTLSGFCKEDYAEDHMIDNIIMKQKCNLNASGMRKEMHFDEIKDEAEYQQELYEELHKWT
eukprot:gene14077-15546_t